MHRVVSQKIKRGLALAAVAASALIAGCGGGGTSQIEAFAPNRIIAFGDETGAILQSGKKYTINALDASTKQIDCASNPVWTQSLASGFGNFKGQTGLAMGLGYAYDNRLRFNASVSGASGQSNYGVAGGASWTLN